MAASNKWIVDVTIQAGPVLRGNMYSDFLVEVSAVEHLLEMWEFKVENRGPEFNPTRTKSFLVTHHDPGIFSMMTLTGWLPHAMLATVRVTETADAD